MIRKKKLSRGPSRKINHIGIFFLYFCLILTFLVVMYYWNADTKLDFKTNFFDLYRMESGDIKYDKAFKNIIDRTQTFTICVILIHIAAYSEAKWYISNCSIIYSMYSFVVYLFFSEAELIFCFLLLLAISVLAQSVANDDIIFNTRLLGFFCKILFHNSILFIIFGVLGYYALDYVLYLIIFKTLVFDSYLFWSFFMIVSIWTFSFVTSLMESVGSSVTIYYLINQEIFTSFYVLKNAVTNILYNIGNISIGKLYIYELNTYLYLKNEYDNFDYTIEGLASVILWTFVYVIVDFYTVLGSDIPNFKMSYTSLFNCSQFNAMITVEKIMFTDHYYEEFRNYFLKSIFSLILACFIPVNYYIFQSCISKDKISFTVSLEYKALLYSVLTNFIIWYITFVFFFSISTTIFYVYVLWPKFFSLVEKKYIEDIS